MLPNKFLFKSLNFVLLSSVLIATISCEKAHEFERKTFESVPTQPLIKGPKRYPIYNQKLLDKQASAIDFQKAKTYAEVEAKEAAEIAAQPKETASGFFANLFGFQDDSPAPKEKTKKDIYNYKDKSSNKTSSKKLATKPQIDQEEVLNRESPNLKKNFADKYLKPKSSKKSATATSGNHKKKDFFTKVFEEPLKQDSTKPAIVKSHTSHPKKKKNFFNKVLGGEAATAPYKPTEQLPKKTLMEFIASKKQETTLKNSSRPGVKELAPLGNNQDSSKIPFNKKPERATHLMEEIEGELKQIQKEQDDMHHDYLR
jgi:hypothetical protein